MSHASSVAARWAATSDDRRNQRPKKKRSAGLTDGKRFFNRESL
jgi:hypothetical protein